MTPSNSLSIATHDHGNGVISLQLGYTVTQLDDLLESLDRLARDSSLKVLILQGAELAFPAGGRDHYNQLIDKKIHLALAQFSCPVIATINGNAGAAAFLMAALCDFMVLGDTAQLRYADAAQGIFPSAAEDQYLATRLGRMAATQFLYSGSSFTGQQLRENGWSCPIVPRHAVENHAYALAQSLATKSRRSLCLLKQHLARDLLKLATELSRVDPSHTREAAPTAQVLAAQGKLVALEPQPGNVLLLELRASKKKAKDYAKELALVISAADQAGQKYGAIVIATDDPLALPTSAILESSIPVVAVLGAQTSTAARLACDAVVPNSANALALAQSWACAPSETVTAWKRERSLEILLASDVALKDDGPPTSGPVPLTSTVISATAHPDGVVVIAMADRDAKNMFSDQFIAGMAEVFAQIASTPAYKVVVLTGYDSYFASGGTKEALVAIQEGKASFTDDKTFRLALDCKLPVIAAMQGHAIGGGLSLGLFADMLVLSEGSQFFSPYMAYGFTPGAGATLIVPAKMGHDLAREALLTAREYAGSELMARGLAHAVHPRKQVLPAAMELAHQAARHPRASLIEAKRQANHFLHERLAESIGLELAMHAQTFVGQADTLQQIHKVFDPMNPAATQSSPSLDDIIASLKTMLAQELQMSEQDVDNDAQFVDLGLDSITGVTWMRKINAAHGTEIAAIKVYSFPTLNQLAAHVKDATRGAAPLPPPGPVAAVAPPPPPRVVPARAGIIGNLKQLLAQELHMAEHEIDEDAQFIDLGLDSITGVTWVRKINAQYGTNIAAIKVYSHPTLNQLAAFVREESDKTAPPAAVPPPAIAQPHAQTRGKLVSWRGQKPSRQAAAGALAAPQPIAVIGMAGQFPQARTLDQFWCNIAEGRNCITEVAPQRWSVDEHYQPGEPAPGKTNSCWLGALDDFDRFDPLFFNISPGEAESMDPQQRLFLEACWHSIEHAGYNPRALAGVKCGVFVGCGSGDYQLQSRELRLSAQGFVGGAPSILAARISYFLNLQGPCISIDTACSSSLVALANACDSLNAGNSDMALAGGVYVMVGPDMQIKTAQAGMLSTDGRCYTFDQRANGFVPGEAVGVVVLKRLADAERDGDPILGLVEGWGVNQDGKTNGITAPNPESQTRLQQDVYDRFQIDPNGIALIEAHGTGTKLGDPIEVAALKESFKKYTSDKQYCAIGSVKSNIGHCLQAAGITSFIKMMLALKHQQLPPTINFERLNEHIDLDGTPFYVNRDLRAWAPNRNGQRQAAISSFGFSGTNAHLVVGQYRAAKSMAGRGQGGPMLVPLSAKSPARLAEAARNLLDFLRGDDTAELANIAYTLQVGREAMEERLCVLAGSKNELTQALQEFIDGKEGSPIMYAANTRRHRESLSLIVQDAEVRDSIIEKCIGQNQLAKLANWWVKGLEFDWNALYGKQKPARMALPVYPFARERYWVDAQAPGATAPGQLQLHPLLHENTSDLYQACFSSTFTGREFFLADHQVGSAALVAPMLPGVAYLEMAREALTRALPDHAPGSTVELRDVVWLQPVVITTDRTVSIALTEDAERIDFSIYSDDGDAQVIHCEGSAMHHAQAAPLKVDLVRLRSRTQDKTIDGPTLYPLFAQMGLQYGPAHQGIAAIHIGEAEMLAELRLPAACTQNAGQYVLHPALADSALQATVGLIFDLQRLPERPAVPFALESIHIFAPCPPSTLAWVRYAPGSRAGDAVVKLDLDLCDEHGTVCVQMRGFAARIMDGAEAVRSTAPDAAFDEVFYQGVIDGLLGDEVSANDAAALG